MRVTFRGWLALATFAAFPGMGVAGMPDIALADQFDVMHRHAAPYTKPTFVVVANNRGSGKIADWITEIYARFGDEIQVIGVADLKGAPDFMKPGLQKLFRQQCAEFPVLLDWSGETAAGFPRTKSGIDVFVVDESGEIVASSSGGMSPQKLEKSSAALSALASR